MAGRIAYYGGIVTDGLAFLIDSSQDSDYKIDFKPQSSQINQIKKV